MEIGETDSVTDSGVSETQPVEVTENDETLELEVDGQEEGEEQSVDDDEEFDWDGKKLRLPKALKSKIENLDRDYTQKTQKVAETRRELEARAQQVEQREKATEEELDAKASIRDLDRRIKPYADLTQQQWMQWGQEAPIDAQNAYMAFTMMQQEHAAASSKLKELQNARTEQAQSDVSQRIQETEKFARTIPGWTPEVGGKIAEFAHSKGMDEAFLKANITPQYYEILHLARIGEQALKKQAAPKPVQAEPLKTVTGRANPLPPTGLDDRLSTSEWMRRRNAQLAARR